MSQGHVRTWLQPRRLDRRPPVTSPAAGFEESLRSLTPSQRSDFVLWAAGQPDPTVGSNWEAHPGDFWRLRRRGWLARQRHPWRDDPEFLLADRLAAAFMNGPFDDRVRYRNDGRTGLCVLGPDNRLAEGADAMRMVWMIGVALAANDQAGLRRLSPAITQLTGRR